jgi:hypothetical protein
MFDVAKVMSIFSALSMLDTLASTHLSQSECMLPKPCHLSSMHELLYTKRACSLANVRTGKRVDGEQLREHMAGPPAQATLKVPVCL